MPAILHIETATQVCSVALSLDGQIMAWRESSEPNAHSARIAVFVEEIMRETGTPFNRLGAISVSKGPGSYTGLRIGVSTAKGLCYALGIPLIAVDTLEAMAGGLIRRLESEGAVIPGNTLYCPMIDARRMEVFTAIFDGGLASILSTRAEVVTADSFSSLRENHVIWFFGDGAEKCRHLIQGPGSMFRDDLYPSAKFLVPLAERLLMEGKTVDPAYFEPYYLKDFIPGIPHVKGLR